MPFCNRKYYIVLFYLLIGESSSGHVRHEDFGASRRLGRDGAERVAAEEHRTQDHHFAESRLHRKSEIKPNLRIQN